jgi:CheY-like chemotaxis protein
MLASQVGLAPERATVLVVEDEVLIRLMIADELRNAGFHVLEASNAEDAWTVLESPLSVHVLFTDIHLPGRMNGVALANLAHERFPKLKLVLTSSRLPEGGVRDVVDAFIPKPYDLAAVVRRVETLSTEFRR